MADGCYTQFNITSCFINFKLLVTENVRAHIAEQIK